MEKFAVTIDDGAKRTMVIMDASNLVSLLDSIEHDDKGTEVDYVNINDELTDFHTVNKRYGIGED